MDDSKRRREFVLALVGSVSVGLAGCTDGTTTPSGTDDSSPRETRPTSDAGPSPSSGHSGDESEGKKSSGETRSTPDSYSVPFTRSGFEAALKRRINEYRSENDTAEMLYDELFREATRQHSDVMATAGDASLEVDGMSASERVGQETNCYADSTVARLVRPESRAGAVKEVLDRWTGEETSREKMMRSFHDQIGVGAAITEDGDVYVTAAYC